MIREIHEFLTTNKYERFPGNETRIFPSTSSPAPVEAVTSRAFKGYTIRFQIFLSFPVALAMFPRRLAAKPDKILRP